MVTQKKRNSELFIAFLPFLTGLALVVVSVFDGSFSARKGVIKLIFSLAISLLAYAVLRGVANYREHGRL
jgi:hypothetical protein